MLLHQALRRTEPDGGVGLALIDIVAMWLAIGLTIDLAREVNRRAALLLVPYFIWVSYATYLNAGFLVLNR